MSKLELSEIIDIQAIKSLMEDFYKLVHIPIGLNDLKGNVLVGVGWQDICTKFHRVHPETCKHCVESNIKLSSGVLPGELKMYKCRNNMWDIVTPIMVGDQHVGYVFAGQFFFEDEPLDYELFRSQAKKYGFNEDEYIAALEKVPRLSRESVDTSMGFFVTFANMISQLSYNNIKLAQSLAERDALVDALQENRKDFDRAQEVGNIGSWRLDVRKNELTWSDEAHRIFGIPKGVPLTYETFLSTVHPDDREYVDKEWKAGLEGKPYDIEHRVLADDNKIKWVREKAYIEFDNNGVLLGGFGITQDITERKKAEEALRFSNIYNRSLIEASLDPLVTIGPDGKIMDVNGATEQVTGHSRNHLIGTDFSDYFTEPEKARKGYQQVFTDGEVRDYPLEIRHKNGHITPVLYNASVYRDENGEVIGVFAAARDITERKNAEKALKKAHENLEEKVKKRTAELEKAYNSLKESEKRLAEAQKIAHIGSWEWEVAADKSYWSDELYRIFGRNPEEPSPNYQEFLSYIHPADRGYADIAVKKALNGEQFDIDYRIFSSEGAERVVHEQGEVIFDEKNTPVRMRGIVQDITEQKKSEEALANLEIARKKEIHHRIKNNLQVISSLLDLQADKFDNPKVIEAFRESQNRVISMALIHEELYKGEGTDTLDFSEYLQELAENLFQTYRLSGKNIHLDMDLEENVSFDMDTAVPLGIIVNELVSNSLKHAFPNRKKGEIRIKLSREENEECIKNMIKGCKSANLTLTISDDGVGIPENLDIEDLDSLGFQLVTSLVYQLDGEFELKRNNGTEFTMRFTVTEGDNLAQVGFKSQGSR